MNFFRNAFQTFRNGSYPVFTDGMKTFSHYGIFITWWINNKMNKKNHNQICCANKDLGLNSIGPGVLRVGLSTKGQS